MPTLVPLSAGRHAIIDDCDAERVPAYKWSYHSAGYACRNVSVWLPYAT